MTQTNFLELAKTGEPRVIAGLLNRSLQSQGITTKATRRSNELHLLLEGESLKGHEDSIVAYLDQALSRLQVPAMAIHIYARFPEQEAVIWRHDLNYQGPKVSGLPTMPSNFTLPMPETAEPEMTPDETQLEHETGFDHFTLVEDGLPQQDLSLDIVDSLEVEDSVDSDDFLEASSPFGDFLEEGNGEQPELSDTYAAAEDSNGHSWNAAGEEEAEDDGDQLEVPEFEEDELPQKSGLPLVPLSFAAIVALLFAGAGAYYRFFMFDQPSDPITTISSEPLPEATPPLSVPSLDPNTIPEATTPETTTPETTIPEGTTIPETTIPETTIPEGTTPEGTVETPPSVVPTPETSPATPQSTNPWRDAINAAMQAAVLAQTAQTAADWGNVAETWDSSIQLLLMVPEGDPNYLLAQDKIVEYTNNLDIARTKELRALGQ